MENGRPASQLCHAERRIQRLETQGYDAVASMFVEVDLS
jgi:hypothetical protein